MPVLLVWLLSASGGMAIVKLADVGLAVASSDAPFAVGASGGALGLLCAWAVPILLAPAPRAATWTTTPT